jgi:hypothetical protein
MQKWLSNDAAHSLPAKGRLSILPATCAMTHIAIYEILDVKAGNWMEQVSDEQYLAR